MDSPTILSDLVHEGTHALDSLSGQDMPRRQLEMRAYLYERLFQIATGAPLEFVTVVEMVAYVLDRY